MNRIDQKFAELRAARQAAFIPFLTGGDPDLDATRRIILEAEKVGADVIELGFPFSDPVADGPVIQASYTRALGRGQRSEEVLGLVASARRDSEIPIVAMISYSLVYRMGFERFLERGAEVGLDGATIPDLPIEESERYQALCSERDFRLVSFVTPSTTGARLQMAVGWARGFIYYIAVRGITGEREALPEDLVEKIGHIRSLTQTPVAVGFGVSKPAQARAVAEVADGVIVGSAIVRRIEEAVEHGGDAVKVAVDFIGEMARAAKGAA